MSNTKRTGVLKFFFVVFFCMASSLYAQKTLLINFTDQISTYKSLEIAFMLTFDPVKDKQVKYEGTFLCSGDKYRLLTKEIDVYCDGRSKWLCNKMVDEVVVQYVSTDEAVADFTDNPVRFLISITKNFSYKQKAEFRMENGKQLMDIELTPKSNKVDYNSVILTFESDNTTLHTIRFNNKNGGGYFISIIRFVPNVEVFDSYFAFPKHKYPDIEMVDLR